MNNDFKVLLDRSNRKGTRKTKVCEVCKIIRAVFDPCPKTIEQHRWWDAPFTSGATDPVIYNGIAESMFALCIAQQQQGLPQHLNT